MDKIKKNIPVLTPINFKNVFIKKGGESSLENENINHFFIHNLENNALQLNLPLAPHKKTVNDFTFVWQGEMTRSIGTENFIQEKNSILLAPKNSITTTTKVSKNIKGFYCHFSNEFLGINSHIAEWSTRNVQENYLKLSKKEAENVHFLLKRIYELFRLNNHKLASSYLATLLAELSAASEKMYASTQQNDFTLKYKALVHKHLKEQLNIIEYAKILNISPNHLNKIIKKETGKTASEIIKDILLLEAKVLLLQTKLNINEIALELGFNDSAYFSRFFKKGTGQTPSTFRKMIDLYN